MSVFTCLFVSLCLCVCSQGVGVYIGEHVFERGSAHTDGWEECWGAAEGSAGTPGPRSLAPSPECDVIPGQAMPCRPQWGMAWDRKRAKNEGSYLPRVNQQVQ